MARVTGFRLNMKGINEVLRSAQPIVDAEGERMAERAGEGFEYQANPHVRTARGYVRADSARARRAEAVDRDLTRAIQGQ